MTDEKTTSPTNNPGFFGAVKSAAWAAIGVQSQANRERDFKQGKPIHFIVAGILLTLTFLISVGIFVKFMIVTNS